MELLTLWNSRDVQHSEVSPIFNEVHATTWNLSSFGAQHTRRSGNVAAHTCARHASNTQGVIWVNDPPNFLLQQLNADCNQSV
jgi:hypothetical protein